ncbi:hypothetical protein CPB83DRAFT_843090 [Crepidotus variabilis]|uniref:RING-type domain-containing protein n=1 Tax=Crepidotus variabilis TaxID=179855 RepID=A0A9P6ERQ4_9AGAR|nr:hypothetical protein CPB83DRAFT_843090 [Crepidotus variabilis]
MSIDLASSNFVTAAAYRLFQDAVVPPQPRIKTFLESLPELHKRDVDLEESCPICLVPFGALFAEHEAATSTATLDPSQEFAEEKRVAGGITKLAGCGHIFCRNDLIEWVENQHGSCPTCRHIFLDIRPRSESDDESSDGGEYIPNADDFEDEDEDAFLETDGFTDASAEEFPVEAMDLDFDELWDGENVVADSEQDDDFRLDQDEMDLEALDAHEASQSAELWGFTDGDSDPTSSSEGDTSMGDFEDEERIAVALEREVSVSVYDDNDDLNPEDFLEENSK